MKKEQLYFSDVDATNCQHLQPFLDDAKLEGLEEITLLKAELDENNDYIWCIQNGEAVDINECKKAYCSEYESKSGRGVCSNRGKLYLHGEEVTFRVKEV